MSRRPRPFGKPCVALGIVTHKPVQPRGTSGPYRSMYTTLYKYRRPDDGNTEPSTD